MRIRWTFSLLLYAWTLPLLAAERVALVIGNDRYSSFQPLEQAGADANRVGDALAGLGDAFEVTRVLNADRRSMNRALTEFQTRLKQGAGEVAFVYYAGHAVSHAGQIWLLPVDAQVEVPADVEAEGIALVTVAAKLRASGWKAVVLVLDACRNELFARGQAPRGFRGDVLKRGLPAISSVDGLLLAYATAPGEIAKEDSQTGGYYTRELVQRIGQSELKLQDVFNDTALAVQRKTGQRPELTVTALEPIYLAGSSKASEGELRISVFPATARVRVNGSLLGEGDQQLRWKSGQTVTLLAEAAGYESAQEQVYVRGGQLVQVSLRLLPSAAAIAVPGSAPAQPPLPQMVAIPAGRYEMGSPSYEEGRESDEGPVTTIEVKGFRLGRFEVTKGEFARFVEATGYRTDAEKDVDVPDDSGDWAKGANPGCFATNRETKAWGFIAGTSWRDPGFAQADNHPVVCVCWRDAQAYIEWLNRETGRRYRLPSEAEQEYAIRAGSGKPYAWGSDVNQACEHANVADQSGAPDGRSWSEKAECNDGAKATAAVGSYAANQYGLHDTVGNAWEWGQDCYQGYARGSRSSAAVEATGCKSRVLRGAGLGSDSPWLRSASRYQHAPVYRDNNTGFRLAEDL